jgi:hypothetical protein
MYRLLVPQPFSSRYQSDELATSIQPGHGRITGLLPGMQYQSKVIRKISCITLNKKEYTFTLTLTVA